MKNANRRLHVALSSALFLSVLSGTPVEATDPTSPEAMASRGNVPSSEGSLPAAQVRGVASYYDDGPGYYAAVPSFKWGDTPYRVEVKYKGRLVTVIVRDHCQCYVGTSDERVIDLSPKAFAELAPLHLGLIRITYERLSRIELPETDTAGGVPVDEPSVEMVVFYKGTPREYL